MKCSLWDFLDVSTSQYLNSLNHEAYVVVSAEECEKDVTCALSLAIGGLVGDSKMYKAFIFQEPMVLPPL